MPGTYRKRIYMSLVHTDSFRQTPIRAHSTQRVNKEILTVTSQIIHKNMPYFVRINLSPPLIDQKIRKY